MKKKQKRRLFNYVLFLPFSFVPFFFVSLLCFVCTWFFFIIPFLFSTFSLLHFFLYFFLSFSLWLILSLFLNFPPPFILLICSFYSFFKSFLFLPIQLSCFSFLLPTVYYCTIWLRYDFRHRAGSLSIFDGLDEIQ